MRCAGLSPFANEGKSALMRPSFALESLEHGDLLRRRGADLDMLEMRSDLAALLRIRNCLGIEGFYFLAHQFTIAHLSQTSTGGGGSKRWLAVRIKPQQFVDAERAEAGIRCRIDTTEQLIQRRHIEVRHVRQLIDKRICGMDWNRCRAVFWDHILVYTW